MLFPSWIYCQTDPPLRIELDVKSNEASYRILPCDGAGFVLFYESTVTEEDNTYWVFVFYDTFLNEKWKTEVPLSKQVSYAADASDSAFAHVIFHAAEKKKAEYNYQIVRILTDNGNAEVFSGNIPEKSVIRDFRVTGNRAFIAYNDEKHSGIKAFGLTTREGKDLYVNDSTFSQIECICPDASGKVWAIFNNYYSKTLFYLSALELNQDGTVESSFIVPLSEGRKYNTAKMASTGDGSILIAGSYDNIKGRDTDIRNYFSNEATGFFTVKIENGGIGEPKFFNFLDFENITGYLKANEFMNARKKANKKGAENLSLDYDLLVHDIYQYNGLFYFVAEGYYEEYHTVTNTYYDYYGRPMPMSYSVFDGYRYFNAFITCFDGEGNKEWDNGLEIFNILTFDLKKMVTAYFDSSDIVLAYNRDGKIAAKIITEGESAEGTDYYPLEASYANDKVADDSKSLMVPWYDNYFICYGFQVIPNDSYIGNEKRTVFYINKVAFR